MISFQRKMALRKQAGGSVAARRKTEALARTGQVARSTVRVGDDDLALDAVLVGAVDEAVAGEARDSDIAFLDESDVDSFDTIIDAGDAADVDSMLDAQDSDPDLIDEFDATAQADEDAHQADMTAIGANLGVSEAQAAAEEAVQTAANAQTTADGKNSRRRGVTEPEAPEGGWVQGDQWVRDNDEGLPVELLVWNGESFVPETILTGELLVIGEDGVVRLKDGTVTADSIAVGALDFVVAHGAQFYGGYIEAPVIVSSDRLGSGANVLNDPTFQSALNTAWVASGHLGDAATNVTDTFTWDQTVQFEGWMSTPPATFRYRGSAISSLVLTPAVRKTGSLLFANFSWKPANRSYNNPFTYPNPMPAFWYGNLGGQSSEEFKVAVPATTTPTARTTYLTNTAVASVVAGERWNVRAGFTKINATDTDLVDIRVELINASTSAVVWFYDVNAAERTAGAINTWYEPAASANLKLRIRAVYTAAGGSTVRRVNPGGWVRLYKDGSLNKEWVATSTDGFHDYGSVPGAQTPQGTRGQPPSKIKRRAEMNVVMTSAVFAKVEPQRGWRLTEDKGLELFNSLGAQTGRVDGENNFLAGRFATKDSGERWEIQGERVVFINASELEVGGLRKSGSSIELFGNFKFQDDTAWASVTIPGTTGTFEWRRWNGHGEVRFDLTYTTSVPADSYADDPRNVIPIGARPSVTSPLNVLVSAARAGSGTVNAAGDFRLRNLGTASTARFYGSGFWPIG